MKAPTPKGALDPIFQAAELLGDAWSWMILRDALFDGVTRFNDFQKRLGIARKVLSKRLEDLSEGGLFERQTVNLSSGYLEYRLTPMGRDFLPCLIAAMSWSQRWFSDQGDVRQRVVHRGAGHVFRPAFCCSECGHVLLAREVAVEKIHRASADLISARRQRMPDLDSLERSQFCAIARTLRVTGDRWSSLLIRECFLGTRRFGDFQEHLGIAPNILINRLDRLVTADVLTRRPSRESSRYEYRLTEKGHDLYSLPLSMLTWAEKWLSRGRPRTKLRHKLCGRPFTSILTCLECGERVGARDVVMEPASACSSPQATPSRRSSAISRSRSRLHRRTIPNSVP